MHFGEKLKSIRLENNLSQQALAKILGTSKQVISRYELGQTTPKIGVAANWCSILGIDLDSMLNDALPVTKKEFDYPSPDITNDVVSFPVIGEIAAGFDQVALEDYDTPDTVEIPASFLKGHPRSDFFVLRVKGNSMYPLYMDGDKVLIKKAPSLERSGEIGAVVYEDYATLKKIEYVMGEDWMKLIPINPEYQPKTITGPDLERCKVLGIPKLLIREI